MSFFIWLPPCFILGPFDQVMTLAKQATSLFHLYIVRLSPLFISKTSNSNTLTRAFFCNNNGFHHRLLPLLQKSVAFSLRILISRQALTTHLSPSTFQTTCSAEPLCIHVRRHASAVRSELLQVRTNQRVDRVPRDDPQVHDGHDHSRWHRRRHSRRGFCWPLLCLRAQQKPLRQDCHRRAIRQPRWWRVARRPALLRHGNPKTNTLFLSFFPFC